MTETIEKIDVVNICEISPIARKEIEAKVAKKDKSFNFKNYVEVRMITASPMRVEIEPIEGTDVEWFRRRQKESEIDISDIF